MVIYVVVNLYAIYSHEKCIKNMICRVGSPGKLTISHGKSNGKSWNFALKFLYEPWRLFICHKTLTMPLKLTYFCHDSFLNLHICTLLMASSASNSILRLVVQRSFATTGPFAGTRVGIVVHI